MKVSKLLLGISFFNLIWLISCKHEPLELKITGNGNGTGNGNQNTGPCDTNIVYFNTDILPIINSNCAMSGCHDPATAKEGVVLNNYANIMNTGRVIPYSPGSSNIYREITTTSAKDIMPPAPKPRLSAAQIALIAKWINQGAKDTACAAGNCDSTNFKYSTAISKTINTFCVGCHGAVSPGGGIVLTSYSGVQAIAANGKLMGSIKQLAGFKPMPVGSKLDDCRIKQIQKWVNSGYLNN
jgi:uncharacterized membrane protein